METQVVGLIDAYDALRSKRSYKEAMTHHKAVETILAGACGQFSPTLLKVLQDVSNQHWKETRIAYGQAK